MQKYGYSPDSSRVAEKVSPAINNPLSKFPSGPSDGLPLVTVCAAVSSFDQVISSPAEIDTLNGM